MNKLRVLDLFAGIGGMSLGLHRTGGFETVKFCEIKPHAQKVLAKNFPGIPCHDDVTTYDFKEGEADVITAGFPCQDLSFAGSSAGLSGQRSGLYREVIRAIRVVRPVRALLENVAALLSRGLGTVLGDLAEVGYDTEWHCIPASALGAPHRRDRVWIVGHPNSSRELQQEGSLSDFRGRLGNSGSPVANSERVGQQGSRKSRDAVNTAPCITRKTIDAFNGRVGNIWGSEPDVGRVADGVPNRMDRLEELGNAVVPQIPEMIGHAILEARAA